MSDGELKKRIKAIDNGEVDPEMTQWKCLEILDEAAKEFPTFQDAEKELLKRIGYEWNDGLGQAAKHQVLSELRDEWFKKWFLGEQS